jgi:hypothetical protein
MGCLRRGEEGRSIARRRGFRGRCGIEGRCRITVVRNRRCFLLG